MDWGLTALAVIASCVLLCFALLKFSVIAAIIKKIITILMPIIYGGVLAYLMLPVYNRTEVCVRDLLSKVIKNDEGRTRIAKSIATLVSLAVLFAIVSGLVSMLIPQIYESIIGFQDSLTEYINNLTVWISKLLQDNEHLQESIMPYYNEAVMRFQRCDQSGHCFKKSADRPYCYGVLFKHKRYTVRPVKKNGLWIFKCKSS